MIGWLKSLTAQAAGSRNQATMAQALGVQSDPYQARIGSKGVHQRALEEQLSAAQCKFGGAEPAFDRPLILLAFTNRSGSNLLADYMRQSDVLFGLGEFLNHDFVLRKMGTLGLSCFPDYIRHLDACCTGHKALGLKASWDQVQMLAQWNILTMFPEVRMLHINRENFLAQAVSLLIADKTQQWTSLQTPGMATEDVEVDIKSLGRIIQAQRQENDLIALIAKMLGIPRHSVVYEALCQDPNTCLRQVLEFCNRPDPEFTVREPALKVQSGALNKRIAEQYLEMLRRTGAEVPDPSC
ncbi:Stf0 family sulfotransferase [Shimia sediminis]|uniref:Stf0 family sulfotransferase n=1 Tax=Shimia sediminis TaxID=2497945 RepID=UPI001981E5F8|nr:Stf0 family sulfotransferase [Shimia sediminis]